MNALTFGLLITALSGFAQGQSLKLIGAELVALMVVGFFFIRRQLALEVPLLPVDPVTHSTVFTLDLYFDMFILRTNAGNGFPSLLPANRARA